MNKDKRTENKKATQNTSLPPFPSIDLFWFYRPSLPTPPLPSVSRFVCRVSAQRSSSLSLSHPRNPQPLPPPAPTHRIHTFVRPSVRSFVRLFCSRLTRPLARTLPFVNAVSAQKRCNLPHHRSSRLQCGLP